MLKINKVVLLGIFVFSQVALIAQNSTNSPYTRFGYGELANRSFGAGRAMGGIGYGLRSSSQINPLNPASYSGMDSLTFILDFGVSAQVSWFDDKINKQSNTNGNLEYIAMEFPLHKRIAMSLGLLPYSYVGYSFGSVNKIDGTPTEYKTQFDGTGGINEIYGGLSVDIWKNRLSAGANVGYLFGNITHESSMQFYQADASINRNWQKISVSDIKLDFGIQYTQPLTKTEHLTFGAVFSPKNTISNKVYKIRQEIQGSSIISSEGDTARNVPMGMPNSYGFGVTYVKTNKLVIGADVLYEQWKDVKFPFPDETSNFENRFRIGAGAEYIPDYMGRNFFSRMKYRIGAHYGNSYLKVNENGYDEIGASIGVGLPLIDNRSLLNVSFEYTKVTPKLSTLINEQYFRVTLNYTFNEKWFFKWKLN